MAAGMTTHRRLGHLLVWTFSGTIATAGAPLIDGTATEGQTLVVDGGTRILAQKSEILLSDMLTTQKDSFAQINFTDGSSVTLRPNSTLRIEQYQFDKAKPEADNLSMRLLKGGLRVLDGLPEPLRMVVELRDIEGLSTEEAIVNNAAERLLNEASLFLHWLEANLPAGAVGRRDGHRAGHAQQHHSHR